MDTISRLLPLRTPFLRQPAYLAFVVLISSIFTLTACAEKPDSDVIQHTRDVRAPDVVVIATSTPISQASATPSALSEELEADLAGTVVVAENAAGEEATATTFPTCDDAYFFEPSPDICPDGLHLDSAGAEQPFENGFMIWLEASNAIYVFNWDGSWRQYEDVFEEGQQEYDPTIIPPVGLYQPVRGFGMVWRENHEVREQLGWALGRELGYESAIQFQQGDPGDPSISFIRAFNGQILALTQRNSGGGDWVVAAS
jgi:hypothetical protein